MVDLKLFDGRIVSKEKIFFKKDCFQTFSGGWTDLFTPLLMSVGVMH